MQYVIMLHAEGVNLKKRGFRRKASPPCRCLTTRVVFSGDKEEACRIAIESARRELSELISASSGDPEFVVEEISVFPDDAEIDAPTKGFLFY